MKVGSAESATLPGTLQGKHETALGRCKAKPASILPPRYSDEPNHPGGEPVSKLTKCPALILVERQGRGKQGGQMKGQGFATTEIEQMNGMRLPLLHDQSGSSSDSSVPLAKKHAAAKSKHVRPLAGTRTKPKTSKEEAPPLPTKKRGRPKIKAPPRPAEDPSDKAILQEKIAPAPAKVPRKRKERVKASVAKDDNNNDVEHEYENTHELPQKKRRRADLTARYAFILDHPLLIFPSEGFNKIDCNIMYCSRNAKENKEISRSAREAAPKMDKVRLSFSCCNHPCIQDAER